MMLGGLCKGLMPCPNPSRVKDLGSGTPKADYGSVGSGTLPWKRVVLGMFGRWFAGLCFGSDGWTGEVGPALCRLLPALLLDLLFSHPPHITGHIQEAKKI